jgi:hypothetical protein
MTGYSFERGRRARYVHNQTGGAKSQVKKIYCQKEQHAEEIVWDASHLIITNQNCTSSCKIHFRRTGKAVKGFLIIVELLYLCMINQPKLHNCTLIS